MKSQKSLTKALSLALIALTSFWFHNVVRAQAAQLQTNSTIADRQARLVVQLSSSVKSVALSRDGKYVLTTGGQTPRLWETATGREVRQFMGHSGLVNSVAISADGEYALTGGDDKTARLWETTSGREVRRFVGHWKAVNSVVFSADGKYVLTGSTDKTARLWETETGKPVQLFLGHSDRVNSVAISADGKYVLTGSWDNTARLWEFETGRQLRQFTGHSNRVDSVAISADGKYVVTGASDGTARLWDAESGKEVRQFIHQSGIVGPVAISGDGQYVLTGGSDTARLWEAATGKEVRRFLGPSSWIESVAFSADDKYVLIGGGDCARLWETRSGKQVQKFMGYSDWIESVAFSADGKYVLTGSGDETARLWDAESGKQVQKFTGHLHTISSVAISADDKYVLTGSADETARLWDAESGKLVQKFESHSGRVNSVAISADGKYVLTGYSEGTARLWESTTGKPVRLFQAHSDLAESDEVQAVAFSPDGQHVLTDYGDSIARLWETESGKEERQFKGHSSSIQSVAFSPDGKYVLTGSWDRTARLWEAATGKQVQQFEGHSDWVMSVAISADGRYVLTGSTDQTARLWEVSTGKEVRKFEGHSSSIQSVAFSPDGKYVLTGGLDSTTRLWDVSNGNERCRLVSFRDGTWAVIDPEGRYDASNNGDVEGMHWVVGNETIELSQLKLRYYAPGLLAKILKGEPLRNVSTFKDVKLFPHIDYQAPVAGSTNLKIKLTNRGGGIGRVRVLVNGKEVIADARGEKPDPQAAKAELTIDLAGAAIKPGEANSIRVLAYNAENWLSSRGVEVNWMPEGKAEVSKPELYAIVGGISSYAAESITLRYAAKDAEDMASALRLGAKRLFGAEKVHITVLSTTGNPGTIAPTKESFRQAFVAARQAKPGDILVVYLSGHGIALRLSGDNDTYCYLTQEARGTDLLDEALRREQSITSDEMTEWIKQIPALKQVMMLDTCAAGAAQTNLSKRGDLSPDQIRALDRLKDRTGFHILMGAAADKVSYEASQYNQGLLTYALLEGMKGAALREDDFVDVSKLFQYAADRVPQLAKSIGLGGVQKPEVAAPRGTSFEIGQMQADDKQAIALASAKPLILRPRFLNEVEKFDDLDLETETRKALRNESDTLTKDESGRVAFVDADELPGAIRPTGTYHIEGELVRVSINLIRNKTKAASFEVSGRKDRLDELAKLMVQRIAEASASLR